jgi:hypothetical protein
MADGAAVDQGRWDWDPFATNWHPTPVVEIQGYRAEPGALAGELAPLRFDDLRGEHPLRVLGRREGDGVFVLSTRDRGGGKSGRRKAFTPHGGRVVLTGFGSPKIPSRYAEPASAAAAPAPPRTERTEGRQPPMPHEMYNAPRAGDDPVLAHVLSQHESAEARAGRAETRAAELAARIEEIQRKQERDAQNQVLTDLLAVTREVLAEVKQVRVENVQLRQEVGELRKQREGLSMQSIEEWCERTGKLQELGVQLPGIPRKQSEGEPSMLELLLGKVLEQVGPALIEKLGPMIMAKFMVGADAPAAAPAPPARAAPRPGPRPFGHGRVQRPVNGNGHASAPEPDAGT